MATEIQRKTLSYPLIEERGFRVLQVFGLEHTAIAVEVGERTWEDVLGVTIRDDYGEAE